MAYNQMAEMKEQTNVKEVILKAAKDAFAEGDFHKTNIHDVAKRARVGVGTIYRYFEDKEHLLFAALESKTEELVTGLREHLEGIEGTFNRIRKLIWYMFYQHQSDPRIGILFYIVVPLKSWMADSYFRKSEFNKMLINIFEEGQAKGEVRTDIDAVIMMDLTYSMIERCFQMWILRQKPKNLTDNTNVVAEIIYKAFRKEAEVGYTFKCPLYPGVSI